MKFNKNIVYWIIGIIVILIIGALLTFSFEFRNAIRWFTVLISFSGVGIIFYSFAGIFTQNKIKKWISTILMVIACILFYTWMHKDPSVVQMKEDVLYVHPKPTIN
jgi:hypothetical protein